MTSDPKTNPQLCGYWVGKIVTMPPMESLEEWVQEPEDQPLVDWLKTMIGKPVKIGAINNLDSCPIQEIYVFIEDPTAIEGETGNDVPFNFSEWYPIEIAEAMGFAGYTYFGEKVGLGEHPHYPTKTKNNTVGLIDNPHIPPEIYGLIMNPQNEVFITETHKHLPKGEYWDKLRDIAKRDNHMWIELYQYTSSERVWAAGPREFFEWWEPSNICAYEFFMDTMVITEGDGDEMIESMEMLFFFDGMLYVQSYLEEDENHKVIYPLFQWLERFGEWGMELFAKLYPDDPRAISSGD